MQRHGNYEIELEHMPDDFFIKEIPDEVGFEYELKHSRKDAN